MRQSTRYSIVNIYEKSRELGEEFSKASLYRHFNSHYTKKCIVQPTYDYSNDDSAIIEDDDIYQILINLLDGLDRDQLDRFLEAHNQIIAEYSESNYPIYTVKILEKYLKEALRKAELDHLFHDFEVKYSKAVESVLDFY